MTAHSTDDLEPLTVGDLVNLLKKLPPNLPVLLNGYEGGYYNLGHVCDPESFVQRYTEWYYGPYERVSYLNVLEEAVAEEDSFQAVVLV
jgi:hypothetical protein